MATKTLAIPLLLTRHPTPLPSRDIAQRINARKVVAAADVVLNLMRHVPSKLVRLRVQMQLERQLLQKHWQQRQAMA
jgi:hypothetical protein